MEIGAFCEWDLMVFLIERTMGCFLVDGENDAKEEGSAVDGVC